MKQINNYILEKLKLNKEIILNNGDSKTKKTLFPKDKTELKQMIADEIKKNGINCSLNHIDVSKITNFRNIFNKPLFISNRDVDIILYTFNGDISEWDVSNVKDMSWMFYGSEFTGENSDISEWDVSNVDDMNHMFSMSKFNSDISNWKINSRCKVKDMFRFCPIKDEYKPKLPQE